MKNLVKVLIKENDKYVEFNEYMIPRQLDIRKKIRYCLLRSYVTYLIKSELGNELFNYISKRTNINKLINYLCCRYYSELSYRIKNSIFKCLPHIMHWVPLITSAILYSITHNKILLIILLYWIVATILYIIYIDVQSETPSP